MRRKKENARRHKTLQTLSKETETPINYTKIAQAAERYEREYDRYAKLAARVADICRSEVLEANSIRAHVTFRAKSSRSFESKLRSRATKYKSVDQVFSQLTDLAAVRIAIYQRGDEDAVVRAIKSSFSGSNGAHAPLITRRDMRDSFSDPDNFYKATHCKVMLPEKQTVGSYANLRGIFCEVQVCSVMAHVWNEIAHDLAYKPTSGFLSSREYELLSALGHLTRAGDGVIEQLFCATDARLEGERRKFVDVYDFVTSTRELFPGVANFGKHADQLLEELRILDLDSHASIASLLEVEQPYEVTSEMCVDNARAALDRFSAWLLARGDTQYVLDGESSDLLLVEVFVSLADEILAAHREGRGAGDSARVAWFAERSRLYDAEWRSRSNDASGVN